MSYKTVKDADMYIWCNRLKKLEKYPTNNGKERKMSESTTKNPRISSKLVVS